MAKGTTTTTTNQSTAPNPTAMNAYTNLLDRAGGVAQTPYTPYGGELVAPVNQQQYAGIGAINQNAGFAVPYINEAAQYARASGTPITGGDIANYQSPYTTQVIDAYMAQQRQNNEQQRQQLQSNAISRGAFGGDREKLDEARLAGQQTLANNQTIAGLENQGYQTALQTALQEKQAAGNAGYALGNLGISGQNAGLAGAAAMLGAGGLLQGTQQALDAANYGQFQQQQAFPYQQTQWLAGLTSGLGPLFGQTSSGTQQTTPPPPNIFNTIAGLGLGGLGVAGNLGWKPLQGWNPFAARGGRIADRFLPDDDDRIELPRGYDDGGPVTQAGFGTGSVVPVWEDWSRTPAQASDTAPYLPSWYSDAQASPATWVPAPFRPARGSPMAPPSNPAAPSVAPSAPDYVPPPADDDAMDAHAEAPQGLAPEGEPAASGSPRWANSLMAAGLGMMASKSPYFGVAVGEGGLKGLASYQQQREQERKEAHDVATTKQQQRMYDLSVRKLNEAADRAKEHLQLQRDTLAETKRQHDVGMMQPVKMGTDKNGMEIYGIRDPKTQQLRPIDPVTGQLAPTMAPDAPDNKPPTGIPSAQAQEVLQQAPDGVLTANAQASSVPFDYTTNGPYIEKGFKVPEPEPVAGRSARSLQADAELYLQKGTLPTAPRGGKSPVAIAQQNYRNAVQNYGQAVAESRGLTPEQLVDMWRKAPLAQRFVLSKQGDQTVALGTAVRHLDTLEEYARAWGAGDETTLNMLKARISREFGSSAATNLETVAHILGPEIVKGIGVAGGGTGKDREDTSNQFTTARSLTQVLDAAKATKQLLGGQLEGKKRQAAAAGISEDKFKELIGERPYEILTHIDKGGESSSQTIPKRVKQNGHTYERQPDGTYKAID